MPRLARFVVYLACLAAFSSRSSAAVVIDIKEVGGNVVASTTGGTLNLNGFTNNFGGTSQSGLIGPSFLWLGSGAYNQFDGPMTISAPYSQAASTIPTNNRTGPLVGFLLSGGSNGILYISNTAAVSEGVATIAGASSTFNSQTLSSLQLTSGIYTISWGSNGNSDSITLNVGDAGSSGEVPEPASAVIAGVLLAATAVRRRSKRVAVG
jgi:hypothetical protein